MFVSRLALARVKARAHLPNAIAGHVDGVDATNAIVGWAIDLSDPVWRLVVECVRDGHVLATAVADLPRADLRQAGLGDGHGGFRLEPPLDALTGAGAGDVRVRVQGARMYLGAPPLLFQRDFLWLVAADIVDNCNLRCPFCLYDYSSVTKTHLMTETTFRKLVTLARVVRPGEFFISCLHEPTLHPRLNELLGLIPEDVRNRIFFTTNLARPLKDAEVEAWARSGLHHINVSLDTLVPERFAVLRKFGRLDVFTANLDRLAAAFRRTPGAPAMRYITMAFKSNLDEIPEIVRVSRERWLSSDNTIRYTFNAAHITDEFRRREYLAPEDWASLSQRLQATGVPFTISHPPADGYEATIKPSQNFFEDRGESPDDQTRVAFTRPMGLRVSSDGTVLVVDAERALRVNLNSLEDPVHFFLSLQRQAQPRADAMPAAI